MSSEHKSSIDDRNTLGSPFGNDLLEEKAAPVPGLTSDVAEIDGLWRNVSRNLAVFAYKNRMPCLWVVFVGGTGTGKSTLFNALCGKSLSETGVERPKTVGPIIYAHGDCHVEKDFPFDSVQMVPVDTGDVDAQPATGSPGRVTVLRHGREGLSHLVVVDTPDLDSVEENNRRMAENLYLMSDAVVFVTSQEKYADEVPYQFLVRILQDGKPHFFLLNKMQEPLTQEEVMDVTRDLGVSPSLDNVWLLPYAAIRPSQRVSEDPAFRRFRDRILSELSPAAAEAFRDKQRKWRAENLKSQASRLLDLIEKEVQAAHKWRTDLDALCQSTSRSLIIEEKTRFTADSRKHIQSEIRRLFAKYDVLAKPRRYIKEIILTPLRALGFFTGGVKQDHKDALSKVRKKIDFSPVLRAVEKFNRSVLETLGPSDERAPLFKALRRPGVVLSDEAIKAYMWQEQDKLDAWIEKTFDELSRGLPRHKRWGIYSTSIMWGILILSLEIVVGGGFTALDAVLDSALAPFVTKGAVELFAYSEIQKTARELAERYQNGLLSVVDQQRKMYEECLMSLVPPREVMEDLEAMQDRIENVMVS